MGRYNFVNSGSAVADTLAQVLAQREAQRRQALLDSITQQREDRMASTQDETLKLARQQFESGQGEKLIENAGANEILDETGASRVRAAGGGGRIEDLLNVKTPGLGVLEQDQLPADAQMPSEVQVLKPGPKFEAARVAATEKADLAKTAAEAKAEAAETARQDKLTRNAESDALRREMGELAANVSKGNATNSLALQQEKVDDKKEAVEKEQTGKRNTAKAMAQEAINTIDQMYDPADQTKTKLSPGMMGILAPGVTGFLSRGKKYIPGSPEANAESLRQQLTGQQVVALIGEMKSQSRTGATGFGALSAPELSLLQAAAGRLSTMQDPVQFTKALNEIRAKLEKVFVEPTTATAPTSPQVGSPAATPSSSRIVRDPSNPNRFIRVP